MTIFDHVGVSKILALWALEWAWQSFVRVNIGIDETDIFEVFCILALKL